jgi:Immunoglobulin I-set domain.
MRLRDRRVQVSYPVRLTCQIVAFPVATVTWAKDDAQILPDGKTKAHHNHWNTDRISTSVAKHFLTVFNKNVTNVGMEPKPELIYS